ncbi:MAG: methyl-accepting chemotaxis protein [Syntrophales bacterium]|jgi:methyl-accepting chemotaxis protein|nr:methyl-accepting chemotaxis protein [Syntrophales bacterium]
MFTKFNLGVKVGAGFLAILLLTGFVSFASWRGLEVVIDRFYKLEDVGTIKTHLLQARRHEKNLVIRGDMKWAEEVKKEINAMRRVAGDVKSRFRNEVNKKQMDEVLRAAASYERIFGDLQNLLGRHDMELEQREMLIDDMDAKLAESGRAVEKASGDARENQMDEMQSQMKQAKILVLGGTALAFGMGVILAFLITRGITVPVRRVVDGLTEGAEQVASASSQVSASSVQLAEGSSQQAASLEETSSSLEEMTAMTRKNAENAEQARQMMAEAQKIVEKVNTNMLELVEAIAMISKTSENTGKIIKTIDEIAFQTNLLALNAAVEAARAGEAGAGFAVVADEVRNLAMRAAEAAKSTNELIESTIKAVEGGNELTLQTRESFDENKTIALKIAQLVEEISSASQEQSRGIAQINIAVSEMDKVTQQTAANAEESASASEEMNAQAEQMKLYVQELSNLIEGDRSTGRGSGPLGRKKPVPHLSSGIGIARKALPVRESAGDWESES